MFTQRATTPRQKKSQSPSRSLESTGAVENHELRFMSQFIYTEGRHEKERPVRDVSRRSRSSQSLVTLRRFARGE